MPVTKEHIDSLVESLHYEYARIGETTTTVCYAFLPNGFRVGQGDSACVNPADYDYEQGCFYARERALADAVNNLWMVEGYLLKVTNQTSDKMTNIMPIDSDRAFGFKEYQGKAITRLAYEVQPDDEIEVLEHHENGGASRSRIVIRSIPYVFSHFEPVQNGDFICYLDEKDIYHVRRSVMEQRNYL